ncbi:MAG: hypothetical protein ACRDTA_21035 [Pseudonocardiaceae bacterium]
MAGRPLQDIGELVGGLPRLAPVPLPARIFEVHVAKVRDLTRRLVEAGRAFGSDPEVSSAAAAWATRLLGVPGAEPVKQELRVAVAELHIHAGWAAFDGCLYDRAMQHYTRALELSTEAGDAYCQALALNCAGLATEEHGHPNDGLKMLQYGQIKAWDIPADDRRTVVGEGSRTALEACGRADAATALARLGYRDAAYRELATSRELWWPTRIDPGGLQLAHGAITGVTKLSSVRARRRLEPLVAALEARSGSDHRELARMARQVVATRA